VLVVDSGAPMTLLTSNRVVALPGPVDRWAV